MAFLFTNPDNGTGDDVSTFGSTVTGQVWYIAEGLGADARLAYFNSDGSNHVTVMDNSPTTDLLTAFPEAVAVDSAAGLYFFLATGNEGINARLMMGHIGSAAAPTVVFSFDPTYAGSENNLAFGIEIDTLGERLYIGYAEFSPVFGDATQGIREFSYDPATGAVSGGAFFVNETTANTPASAPGADSLFASRDLSIDTTHNVLYSQSLALGDGFETNIIMRFSLSSPGAGVAVVDPALFPLDGDGSDFNTVNGIIDDIEVDQDSDRLYFVTRAEDVSENTGEDAIWMVGNASTATNATPTKLALVGISQADFYPTDITLDEVNNILYVESENSNLPGGGTSDAILIFQLDAAGTQATLIDTIPMGFGATANVEGLHFNYLASLSGVTGTASAATEQGAAIALLTAPPAISDFDGDHLASATVRIAGGSFNSNENSFDGDELGHGAGMAQSGLIAGTNITIGWNQATGTLTLTGYDTLANYQSVLNAIHFQSGGDNPTNYGLNPSRTIGWTISDGLPGIPDGQQNSATTTINISAVNDAPVNDAPAAISGGEDSAFVAVTGLSVSDPDTNPALTDITVTLSVGHGVLTLDTAVALGLTAADIAGNGTATVTVTATINEINATLGALNGLRYSPAANFNGSDTLHVVTNDGAASDTDDYAITIGAVNDAPTVTGDGSEDSAAIYEDQPSVTGQTVYALFSGQYSDQLDNQYNATTNPTGSSPGSFGGIAVIGNAAGAATGNWEYFEGGVWKAIPTDASLAGATLIGAGTAIRFNPAADYNGPEPLLTVRLVDNSLGFGIDDGQIVDISGGGATGGTSAYSTGSVTLGGTVLAVNDAPTAANLQNDAATWVEGGSAVFLDTGSNAAIDDIDSDNFDGGMLTVSIASPLVQDGLFIDTTGTVTTPGAGVLAVGGVQIATYSGGGYGGGDLVFTFDADATPDAVQALIRAITYNNNGGINPTGGTCTINWTLIDGDGDANGGEDTLTVSSTVEIQQINDAPTGADATYTIDEDTAYIFSAASFGFNDVDGDNFTGVVLTTLPAAGTLSLNGLPIIVFGTFVSAADIDAGRLRFTPDPDDNGNDYASFTFQVTDDGDTGGGGGGGGGRHLESPITNLGDDQSRVENGGTIQSAVDTDQSPNRITFNVTAVNDAPINSVPGAQVMNEDNTMVLSTVGGNAISVGDVDSAMLTVTLAVGHGALTLGGLGGLSFIAGDGTGDTTMTFIGSAIAINAALDGLTYAPGANYNGDDTLVVTTIDDNPSAGIDIDTVGITINSVNDAPAGTDGTITVSENDNYYFTAADFGFTDIDGDALDGIVFTTVPGAGTIYVELAGTTFAATAGLGISGSALLTMLADGKIWYEPPADQSGNDFASFTFQVEDDGGVANGGVKTDPTPNTMTIDIEPDNNPPVVDLNGAGAGVDYATTFVEDGTAVAIGAGITISDEDVALGDLIEGATVTLTDRVAGDSLTFSTPLPLGFSAIFTSSAGSITIEISGTGTAAQYQAMLQSLAYATSNQDPTVGGTDPTRTITVTVNDGDDDSAVATTTVNITAVDDLPVAQPDAFTINENGTISGGNLFADNGSGPDTDPDGPPLSIAAVNGSAANVGTTITLASGASLTVNANGTFDYDPGDIFLPTPTAGSGAVNTPAHDSFTYTLAGAGTVTVTITLTGLDTDDLLLGTAGVDILMAGVGDDTLIGGASGDVLNGGADSDTASYRTATTGVTVSLTNPGINTGDAAGDSFISIENLEGSAFADVLIGDAGGNGFTGGDGTDLVSYRTAASGVRAFLSMPAFNAGEALGDSYSGIENLEGSGYDDVLGGDAGANDFLGGNGFDIVTYYWASAGVVASLGNGTVGFGGGTTQTGEAAGDRYNAIEVLEGSLFNDVLFAAAGGSILWGLDGADTLYGLGGSDRMMGDAGQDTLIGDDGADILYGGDDNDMLRGDAGADTLYGDGGNDTLDGGAGKDVLYGGAGNDSYTGGGGADRFVIRDLGGTDTITDFKRAQGDKIDLRDLAIDEWIGTQAFHNDAGEVRIRNAGSQWWLEGDTNGDGIADFSVAVGNVQLIQTDLLIG